MGGVVYFSHMIRLKFTNKITTPELLKKYAWPRRIAMILPIIILIVTILNLLNTIFFASGEAANLIVGLFVAGTLSALLIYAFIQIKKNRQSGYLIMFFYFIWQVSSNTTSGTPTTIGIITLSILGIAILLYGFLLKKMFIEQEKLDSHE